MAPVPSPSARLAALAHARRRLAENDLLEDVLGALLRDVGRRTGLERVSLSLVDPVRQVVRLVHADGLSPAEIRRSRYPFGEGIIGRLPLSQLAEPVLVRSIQADDRHVDRAGSFDVDVDRAFVAVPVLLAGEVVAVLAAYRPPLQAHALHDDALMLSILGGLLARALARERDRGRVDGAVLDVRRPDNIIGRSGAMLAVFADLERVSSGPTTVLITGESGTGKELVAQAIHSWSERARRPFIAVNCAALPEGVIESELFGHERGAFTGAVQQRQGRFEQAHTGTLFLDEIGDLSPASQVKLLRVLQERQIERVGGSRPVAVDVRVIAATSRDLERMVAEERFRADLYYRLAVFPVHMPPLRERGADIVLLADHFVERFSRSHGHRVHRISSPAIDMLTAYHWPGNVRELENCIERAVLLAHDGVILGHHLPPSLQTAEASGTPTGSLQAQLAQVEKQILLDALKSQRGNRAAAARDLHISERVMGLRVKKYGIDWRAFRRR